jgi:hypothetical protein
MALLAPIPIARVMMAMMLMDGRFNKPRTP